MVSGLASSIRSATESATFDLAGQDANSIKSTFKDAFSQPLALTSMIRITFVVGGGKLSRQKYDAKAGLAVTSSLQELGYEEDRGASCVLECGGCYKTQHDTGKNQFTVIVFPKVVNASDGTKNDNTGEDYEPLIPENSPGYKMAVCSKQTLQNLICAHVGTYLEKKECLHCLEGLLQVEQAIENKMMKGHPLDSAEQSFYDEASELKEKHALVQKEASKHVEEGRLTSKEKRLLVDMNEKRIETLMKEKSSATVAEKLKKALARKQQLKSLTDDVLSMNASSYPPPLRYEAQITAMRKKLLPLQTLEDSSKGRLLTLSETRSLTEKGELENEIERLELASCGWFEDEDAFEERLRRSRDKFQSKFSRSKRGNAGAKSAGGSKLAGGSGANAVNKWILPGEKPKNAWGSSASGKGKLKGKGGAVFTAMMMDSSSDEESESDEEHELEVKSYAAQKKKQHPAASNVLSSGKPSTTSAKTATAKKSNQSLPVKSNGGANKAESTKAEEPAETESKPQTHPKKSKKKKGKKNKKSKSTEQTDKIPEATNEGQVQPKDDPSAAESPSSLSASLLLFWQSFLLPLIMAIVNLLVSLVTSMISGNKTKKGKKRR